MMSESIPFHTNSFEDDIDSQNLDFRLIFPWFMPNEENGIMPYNDLQDSEHEKEEPSIKITQV